MSYHTYPLYGFGLIISDEKEIDRLLEINGYTEEDGYYNYIYDFASDNNGTVIDEEMDSPSYSPVDIKTGEPETRIELPYGSICFYTEKGPRVLNAPYKSLKEIEKEFRKRINLPEGFSVINHLGYFSATYGS